MYVVLARVHKQLPMSWLAYLNLLMTFTSSTKFRPQMMIFSLKCIRGCVGLTLDSRKNTAEASETPCSLRLKSCWLRKLATFFVPLAGGHSWCLMARAIRFLWLLVSRFIGNPYQRQFLCNIFANGRTISVMLTPSYFFIFCILIKNSQKMAWLIERISEQIAKQKKQLSFLFRSYKPL